jgi:hypothetical protein
MATVNTTYAVMTDDGVKVFKTLAGMKKSKYPRCRKAADEVAKLRERGKRDQPVALAAGTGARYLELHRYPGCIGAPFEVTTTSVVDLDATWENQPVSAYVKGYAYIYVDKGGEGDRRLLVGGAGGCFKTLDEFNRRVSSARLWP